MIKEAVLSPNIIQNSIMVVLDKINLMDKQEQEDIFLICPVTKNKVRQNKEILL